MSSEFTKDKVTWTKSMNLELAKFMEAKPNIWDPKHPKFSHVGLRDEAFAEFAAMYDDLSWQAVKDRWTNIRSTFGFYMRKINTRKENGGDFKVGWFMWKPLKYLYKVHKYAKPKTTTEQATEQVSPPEKKHYRSGHPWRVQDRLELTQADESSSQDAVMANDNENYVSNDAVFSDNSEEQRDNVTCEGIVNNIAVVFKGVQNEDFEATKSKYAAVGEAVTTMLSQLNSYEAARMSQKITEILAEYDEKNPVNPNDLRTKTKESLRLRVSTNGDS